MLLKRKELNISFVIVVAIIITISGFAIFNFTKMNESNVWVQHTDSVLFNLEATLSILKDAETGSRGYLLTTQKTFLTPYYTAISKLDENILSIKKLTADNPLQQKRVDTLHAFSYQVIFTITEAIKSFDLNKHYHNAAIDYSIRGKIYMDQIRSLIDRMKDEETRLWKIRDKNFIKSQEEFLITFIVCLFAGIVTLIIILYYFNRQIKETSKAERSASESRNILSITLSSIGDAVISTDEKGLIRFMNKIAENLTGWSSEEAEGRYVEDVFHIVNEHSHQEPENPVIKALTTATTIGLANHTVLITKDGIEVPIDDSSAPIINGDKIIGAVLIFRDITLRRNLEIEKNKLSEEIINQKNFLDQVLSASSDGIFVNDQSLKFYYVNKGGGDIFKKDSDDFTGHTWSEIVPLNKNTENLNDFIKKVFATRQLLTFNYYDDTEKKHYEFISNPFLDNNGNVEFVVSSVRDITGRKLNEINVIKLNSELENKLAEIKGANEEMESFIYTVSHDLRAPIRHISGFLEILSNNIYNSMDEGNQRYFNIIAEATVEMGKLIDDLLSFSRLGRSPLKLLNVNLNGLVQTVIKEFAVEIAARKVKWEIAELPDIYADPSLLKVVLSNLISNAIKYTSHKGEAVIKIGFENKGNGMTIYYVKDNGVGFDMKYYDKLFGVFQRLHSQDEFEGTGIGLATVKKIIQKHGGNVWAEGKINEGAAFYFFLPIYS